MADVQVSKEDQEKADVLKSKGNEALKKGDTEEAIKLYSQAIEVTPSNHVLYSNRCAAYMKLKDFDHALEDAETTVKINPQWTKGYSRQGAALFSLQRYEEAEDVYRKGLELDPNNEQLKDGLRDTERKKKVIPNPFADPGIMDKLRTHPKTSKYMDDPTFVSAIQDISSNQESLGKYLSDSRIIDAMSVLLGINLETMPAPAQNDPFVQKEGKGPSSSELTGEDSGDETQKEEKKKEAKKNGTSSQKDELSEDQKKALEEKEKGNEAYKQKDFITALARYDNAIELDPTNVTFLTNKAAVYFEQQEWDKCVEMCELAVEKGREVRADFKVIAKALARIGNTYFKQKIWGKAVQYFDKSLAEHRNPEVVKKRQQADKQLKEEERQAYINPEMSLQEKGKGNEMFKKGDFPAAVKAYTEAIKRNPDDPKLYSNRAACYQKLLEFPLALKDCEQCTELDPSFVKGHIRKGHAYLGLKDTVKAEQAFAKALELDPNNADAKTGKQKCYIQDDPEARRKAAMHDPEVQAILGDPAMQLILQQMQSNPAALRDHLKDPQIAQKIQKLIEAGFISLR